MKNPPSPPSKLVIRSEVLAVIDFLSVVEAPSRQDRLKQIKRLSNIPDQKTVMEILVKELQRASVQTNLQAVSELLMELGTLELLQESLWTIIRNNDAKDEAKDAANLILRHLGDQTDPDLYLDYLDDPQGLINRETERMLEVAARNPEALIDFIDFIFSLPVEEQCNLILSLHSDYAVDHLLNIHIPTLLAQPPLELQELVLKSLGQSRSKRAALALNEFSQYKNVQENEDLLKLVKKAANELRIGGVYKEDQFVEYEKELAQPHELIELTTPYKCYVTLPDGIGNQGIIFGRKRENGDVTMMSVAINDLHGIIDCFGFYQISESDFHKISEKFHAEATKIEVDPGYCLSKLHIAEKLNMHYGVKLPYEYTCWKVLLGDIIEQPLEFDRFCEETANAQWVSETANLYQHPDFKTWFLEEEDHPVVTEVLKDVPVYLDQSLQHKRSDEEVLKGLSVLADAMVRGLFTTEWRDVLIQRLADTAFLLNDQQSKTFSVLAATEVMKLKACSDAVEIEDGLAQGFIGQFGKRCIEEHLLRLRDKGQMPEAAMPWMEKALATWDVT